MLLVSPPDSVKNLQAVTVSARSGQAVTTTQNAVQVDASYLEEHFAGSLMQSLEGIPGVKAVSIGAGLSKPTIRGLGYNRMVVSQDGIKHEGQQWGDDHGLEVDQFAVDAVEVIKGPATLLYGSDAIGGVLSLSGNRLPTVPFEVSATLFGRTNNLQGGFSGHLAGRKGGFFYKANLTLSDYADYRVPTDSIQYYSYWIRLHDQRLRNTAGLERDGRLMVGWTDNETFRTDLTVSDVYARSGFFADAHGMEVRLSQIDYNRSLRDVDLPYQWVNHLKVQSHTTYQLGAAALEANLAWQHNLREELSEPLSHGYMPTPPDSLERRFDKHTFSGTLGLRMPLGEQHELSAGLAAEHQRNRREGWGFIIPDFESSSMGVYALDRWTPSTSLALNGGLRFDLADIAVHPYSDWYPTPTSSGDSAFLQRSADARRTFNSITWSLGANWHRGDWILRLNVGKAFRVPIAKELGADGVNYHIFRYEQGNADLDPERSYQVDAGLEWSHGALTVKLDPYFNYFPNYIYLNPTADYVEGLQLYRCRGGMAFLPRLGGVAARTALPFAPDEWRQARVYASLRRPPVVGRRPHMALPFPRMWQRGAESACGDSSERDCAAREAHSGLHDPEPRGLAPFRHSRRTAVGGVATEQSVGCQLLRPHQFLPPHRRPRTGTQPFN